jgi:hypothetical protein
MKLFSILIFIFLINIIPVSHAGSGEFNGIWLLTRDHILDGILDPTKNTDEVELAIRFNSHHNHLVGEYTNIENDSVFTGETYTARGTTLIVLFQHDKSFYVIHNGHKVDDNRYAGTWFATGNLAGDFELKKKS